jgi:hypothetical protein
VHTGYRVPASLPVMLADAAGADAVPACVSVEQIKIV